MLQLRVPCVCAGLLSLAGVVHEVPAATIAVPGDFPTIQAAANAAVDGDEVVVAPGIYSGPGNDAIDFAGKSITVRGAAGAAATILDSGLNDQLFVFNDGEGPGAVVEDLTLRRGFGGAIRCFSSSPTIRNCIVTDSYGFDWGSGIYADDCASKVTGCVFSANLTDWFGAAIMLGGSDDMEISDCVFTGNVGYNPGAGGVIVYNNAHATITNCIFTGNLDAAIRVTGVAEIVNCLFSGNQDGGIQASDDATVTVTNCTFRLNDGTGAGAGGVHAFEQAEMVIANSIFWQNLNAEINAPVAATSVDFSLVQGGWAGPGDGNLDADPVFIAGPSGTWTSSAVFDPAKNVTTFTDVDAGFAPGTLVGLSFNPDTSQTRHLTVLANTATTISVAGNFDESEVANENDFAERGGEAYVVVDSRIDAGSPAIDAGDNAAVPAGAVVDLAGNPRFVDDPATPDTGEGMSPLVDIGAFEFQPRPVPGDLNGDGAIDGADLGILLGNWGRAGRGDAGDLDASGTIDGADLGILLGEWTG